MLVYLTLRKYIYLFLFLIIFKSNSLGLANGVPSRASEKEKKIITTRGSLAQRGFFFASFFRCNVLSKTE